VIDPCKEYDAGLGQCRECILGYFLQGVRCFSYASLPKADPNCKTFQKAGYCIECYSGFIALAGNCSSVDPLCRTLDKSNGDCASCYQGYQYTQGKCVLAGVATMDPCQERNGQAVCLKCRVGYRMVEG
jgi:hypothetical protein